MNQTISRERLFLLMLVYFAVVSFAGIGSWGVIETSEARYAEISREMADSNDWLHPTLLDVHHYHKPPLTYWITAIGLKVFGVNGVGVRFFLQVAFLVQIYLVYRIGSMILHNDNAGLLSSVIYA